jgi:hypothetical protein
MSEVDDPHEHEGDDADDERRARTAMVIGWIVVLGLLVLAGLVLFRIYPGSVPSKENPGFLDNIFDNNLVVFAARLVLFSAALVLAFTAVYTIASIVSWMRLGHWLTRAGPFEVSREAVETLTDQVAFWRETAIEADAEREALRQRLEETDELVEHLYEERLELEGQLERSREQQAALDGWAETRSDWRDMATVEQLDKRVERTREKNRRAVRYARERSATLHREAELSDQAIRRALKSLRRAGVLK